MPKAGQPARRVDPRAFLDRHYRACLAALCLLGVALVLFFARNAIASFSFSDPDDIMRLLEVRDWLNGQSWFDVTQYRLDPPAGFAMHWSRLVDMPIALLLTIFKPWLGQRAAETIACAAVPMVTLTIVTLLVSAIARRLFGTAAALLAALFCFLNAGTFSAIWPMRIDHHGWEATFGLGIVFFLLRRRDAASAALAGLCAACWTHISLEGIAFTAGAACWLGLRWLIAPEAEGRRLPAFLGALAAAGLGLFLTTHHLALLGRNVCDAISPVHIVVFALAAALTAVAGLAGRAALPVRLLALAGAAGACGALYRFWTPQCLAGPFAMLTPLSYRIWYLNVHEGLPIWHNGLSEMIFWIVGPLIGLAGGLWAAFRARDAAIRAWVIDYTALLAVAAAVGILVLRACIFANLLALPGEAAIILIVLDRVANWPGLIRILVRASAVVLLSPMGPQFVLQQLVRPHGHARVATETVSETCRRVDNFRSLDALPAATFMAPLDLSPALIAGSHHSAVGSGYHRNAIAIEDVLRFFGSTDRGAQAIARRHGAHYLAYCSGDNLVSFMSRNYPASLSAELHRGSVPHWLHPVATAAADLKLYRIDQRPF